MLEQGVWLPPSQFEAAFLGTAHGEGEVSATIEAAREALSVVLNAGPLNLPSVTTDVGG